MTSIKLLYINTHKSFLQHVRFATEMLLCDADHAYYATCFDRAGCEQQINNISLSNRFRFFEEVCCHQQQYIQQQQQQQQ